MEDVFKILQFTLSCFEIEIICVGDAVAWWLAHWSPDRKARVRALASSCIVCLGKTLYCYSTGKMSGKPDGMLGGGGGGGLPAMD